jgi:hypothetical protein
MNYVTKHPSCLLDLIRSWIFGSTGCNGSALSWVSMMGDGRSLTCSLDMFSHTASAAWMCVAAQQTLFYHVHLILLRLHASIPEACIASQPQFSAGRHQWRPVHRGFGARSPQRADHGCHCAARCNGYEAKPICTSTDWPSSAYMHSTPAMFARPRMPGSIAASRPCTRGLLYAPAICRLRCVAYFCVCHASQRHQSPGLERTRFHDCRSYV